MKLVIRVFLSILFVIGMLIVNLLNISAVSADMGIGTWILPDSNDPFTIVDVQKDAKSAPEWLQQFSDGIKINHPNKICYTFRGGDYGWVPQIREYKDNSWVKILTTTGRIFGKEAPLYACAEAPHAGLYALFAYYSGPPKKHVTPSPSPSPSPSPTPEFDCSTINWSGVHVYSTTSGASEQHWEFEGTVEGVPASTGISWAVTEADPSFYVAANGYAGSTLLGGANYFYVSRYISTATPFSVLTVLFTESSHGCTYTGYLIVD